MNWIYIAVTFGLAAVAWWVIRSDVRKTTRHGRQLALAVGPGGDFGKALATAPPWPGSALDAGMERIVTPGQPVPYRLTAELPVGSLHGCGCFVEYMAGGDVRISPCPRHEERGDWITWEQQMKERSK